jgi:predicted HTH domain antitoxin
MFSYIYKELTKTKDNSMGIFWDLLQQDEIEKQQKQADSLEDRVEILEKELEKTQALLKKTLVELEKHLSKDIDGDGKTG